jgi:hypothetical protein
LALGQRRRLRAAWRCWSNWRDFLQWPHWSRGVGHGGLLIFAGLRHRNGIASSNAASNEREWKNWIGRTLGNDESPVGDNLMKRFILAVSLLLCWVRAASAQVLVPAGFTKLNTALVTTTTFTDTACPNQTTCYYYVTAVDSIGAESNGAPCAAAQLCVNGNMAVAQMPSSGTHTVTVSWTASVSTVAGYNVYVHRGPLSASNLAAIVN